MIIKGTVKTTAQTLTGNIKENAPLLQGNVKKTYTSKEVYEAGKQAEYDAFWDMLQVNGNRTDYQYAFYNWDAEEIKPKHTINTTSIYGTFWLCKKLKKAPMVSYIGSGFTNMFRAFHTCRALEEIPFDIVMNSADTNGLNQAFMYCNNLKSLKLVLDGTAYTFAYAFSECYALEELTIEGEINNNGMNLSACSKLTHDSILSVINALADKSADTSGTTWKITLGGTNLTKMTDDEIGIAQKKGWDLV